MYSGRSGSSLRGSSPRHGSVVNSGSLKQQPSAEQIAHTEEISYIKISHKSLQDKPSEWSSRNGLLTSDSLTKHLMKTPAPSKEETETEKIRRWAEVDRPPKAR